MIVGNYQKGDRVRVRDLPDLHIGFRKRDGEVIGCASDGCVIVKLNTGRIVHFYKSDLDPLPSPYIQDTPAPAPEPQPERVQSGPDSPTPKHYNRCCPRCSLKLDPYRISDIYGHDGRQHHLAKKALCAGDRGHKDLREDLNDIINTARRWLEMLDEDEQLQKEQQK